MASSQRECVSKEVRDNMKISEILTFFEKQNTNDKLEYGAGFFNPPATDAQLAKCKKDALEKFGLPLDDEYIYLLKNTNGMSYNGLNIYGCEQQIVPYFLDGVIDANVELWSEESLRQYVAYSEESTTRLVYDIEKQKFVVVDRVTWDELESFDTFAEALTFNIEDCCIYP